MKQRFTNATNNTETPAVADEGNSDGFWSEDAVIFKYSRADAISDGVLIDASKLAREAGFRYPVALTSAAWHECIAVAPTDHVQDETGRLWDVLMVLRFSVHAARGKSETRFCVAVCDEHGRRQNVELRALCGPGDHTEPVITIMLPGED